MNKGIAIPEKTMEALARSFYKEASAYGFKQADYLRFVNTFLDVSMMNGLNGHGNGHTSEKKLPRTSLNILERVGLKRLKLPLAGNQVRIRQFHPENDRADFERWIKDEEGRYFLLSRLNAKFISYEQLCNRDRNLLGLITVDDEHPVGLMAYLDFDREQRKAELRKLIGEPEFRGRGLAKEATRLWIEYGLNTLGLKKIYLNTLNTNIRNIRLNEELGFRVEGIMRNEIYFDQNFHDVLRMGMWKE